jgi:hypothetical protein
MRYVKAKAQEHALEKAYRIYTTDSLKMISENTSKYAGGSSFSVRYWDMVKKPVPETRTGEEIIDGIKGKLKMIGG